MGAEMRKTHLLTLAILALLSGACTSNGPVLPTAAPSLLDTARAKIKHVVVIMQENRSFDSYFGTFPAADGIPMQNGVPTVCVPDPRTNQCQKPYHDSQDKNMGGPQSEAAAAADINGGKMDGFISQELASRTADCASLPDDPNCSANNGQPDVMGYHDAREIPNYWTYAQQFVLQDHMFEPAASSSLAAHLYLVSEWAAQCSHRNDPTSCVTALRSIDLPPDFETAKRADSQGAVKIPNYAWTDLTYLLYRGNVSWAYYVANGTEPDCVNNPLVCIPKPPTTGTPGVWNPLPWFTTVQRDGQMGNIQTVDNFYQAARDGKLPAVSWVAPDRQSSEQPPALVSDGQAYVTGLVNALMQGPDWDSTAIFISWSNWGGFYDHYVPPTVDANGYGLRVPGLMISPYAKQGFIDNQMLSFDAYAKLIEDLFMKSWRMDRESDGRWDPRPGTRDQTPDMGDLLKEFDFSQSPRSPLVLQQNPPPGPASVGY